MIEYIVIKKEKEVLVDILSGSIDFSNLKYSNFPKDVSKIPKKNQDELNEKGETEFTIITETIVNLKKVI
jgi:hypothetical protein